MHCKRAAKIIHAWKEENDMPDGPDAGCCCTCTMHWQNEIFLKENADEMSIFEGRSYINGLLRLDR